MQNIIGSLFGLNQSSFNQHQPTSETLDLLENLLQSSDSDKLLSDSLKDTTGANVANAIQKKIITWSQGAFVINTMENGTKYTYTLVDEQRFENFGVTITKSSNGSGDEERFVTGMSLSSFKWHTVYKNVLLNQKGFLHLLAEGAEGGDAAAQYYLGLLHQQGTCVEPDLKKAHDYFCLAVKGENHKAMYECALLLEKGWGCEKNAPLAENTITYLAGLGYQPARNALLVIRVKNGDPIAEQEKNAFIDDATQFIQIVRTSVKPNGQLEIENFRPLADKGFAPAQCLLGLLTGTHSYLEKAAAQGFEPALHELGMKALRENNIELAKRYFTQAAQRNYPASLFRLGMLKLNEAEAIYLRKEKSKRDQLNALYKDALHYFQKAAQRGYARAQDKIGRKALHDGDVKLARDCFNKAATRGFRPSRFQLIQLDLRGQYYAAAIDRLLPLAEGGYAPANFVLFRELERFQSICRDLFANYQINRNHAETLVKEGFIPADYLHLFTGLPPQINEITIEHLQQWINLGYPLQNLQRFLLVGQNLHGKDGNRAAGMDNLKQLADEFYAPAKYLLAHRTIEPIVCLYKAANAGHETAEQFLIEKLSSYVNNPEPFSTSDRRILDVILDKIKAGVKDGNPVALYRYGSIYIRSNDLHEQKYCRELVDKSATLGYAPAKYAQFNKSTTNTLLHEIPTDVINKITSYFPPDSMKDTLSPEWFQFWGWSEEIDVSSVNTLAGNFVQEICSNDEHTTPSLQHGLHNLLDWVR